MGGTCSVKQVLMSEKSESYGKPQSFGNIFEQKKHARYNSSTETVHELPLQCACHDGARASKAAHPVRVAPMALVTATRLRGRSRWVVIRVVEDLFQPAMSVEIVAQIAVSLPPSALSQWGTSTGIHRQNRPLALGRPLRPSCSCGTRLVAKCVRFGVMPASSNAVGIIYGKCQRGVS